MNTMDEFMEHTLQDLYSAETQALEAMNDLKGRVQDKQLQQAFDTHIRETEQQIQRLEQVAEILGVETEGETCMAMQGLIEEAQDLISQIDNDQLIDAAVIGAAQKMEHYEIACYGTARTLAMQAGQQQVAELFEQTLQEEKNTDQKLTQIAESKVNQKAAQA